MISEYLARLGLQSAPALDVAGLDSLQRAHTSSIPFETLDISLGRGIRIDSDSVFDKLIRRGRGGYCFEQNRLFSDALKSLGLKVRPLLARGLLDSAPGVIPAFTHKCLLAELQSEPWLLDAGFGALYIAPMPLTDGFVSFIRPQIAADRGRGLGARRMAA